MDPPEVFVLIQNWESHLAVTAAKIVLSKYIIIIIDFEISKYKKHK